MNIIDHSNYPKTRSPKDPQPSGDHIEIKKLIMGREESPGSENQNMMEMSILLFHFPLERNCPLSQT